MKPHNMEIRCTGRTKSGMRCNKLLAVGLMEVGEIELACPRCGTRLRLRASRPNPAPHDGLYGDRHACQSPRQSSLS